MRFVSFKTIIYKTNKITGSHPNKEIYLCKTDKSYDLKQT